MALDPIISRGYQGQIGNALQDARRSQKANTLLDLRAQQMQGELDDDAEWDQAYAAKDVDTMMRIAPQETQLLLQHWESQKMAGLGDVSVTAQKIETAPLQKQENWAAEQGRAVKNDAADNAHRGAMLRLAQAQEARLSQQPQGEDEFARYSAMTPQQRELYDRMKGRPVAGAKSVDLARANNVAWNVYQTGMAGVKSGMEGSVTGPIAGRIPAYTAAQQSAEGAVSAMAPVLKQLFRSAGEGVFTDKDQQLLLDMMPTRKDHAEAREFKLNNIDNIVRAKLGLPPLSAAEGSGDTLTPAEKNELEALRKQFGNK
jgi:hypothetical protein